MTVISNEYSTDEIAAAEFPEEKPGMRSNVEAQKGWLVLSPRAEQVVVTPAMRSRRRTRNSSSTRSSTS